MIRYVPFFGAAWDGIISVPAASLVITGYAPSIGGATFTIYEAEDQTAAGTVTSYVSSMRATFMSKLTVSGVEDFEDSGAWAELDPADGQTSTINGVTVTYSDPDAWGALYIQAANNGRFNTTSSPTQELFLECGQNTVDGVFVRFAFDTPIAAFGAYFTDMGDFNGQVGVRLYKYGGGTATYNISHLVGGVDASLLFWGFVDTGLNTYTQMDVYMVDVDEGGGEGIGIDDIVVATQAQLAT